MLRDEGAGRAPARVQHGDPRRGAPAAGHRDAVLRRAGRPPGSWPSSRATPRSPRAPARATCPTCPTPRPSIGARDPQAAPRRRRHAGQARRATPALRATGFARRARRARRRARPARRPSSAHFAERSEELAQCRARAPTTPRALVARWRDGRDADRRRRPTTRSEWIRWVDVTPHGWQLHASPLSVADLFRRQVERIGARVDLHVGHARGRPRLLALPARAGPRRRGDRLLGEPVRLRDAGAALRAARPARAQLAASTPTPWSTRRCRCSRRAAAARSCCSRRCARSTPRASCLADAFARDGLDWPLLVQGEGSRSELLARFRELGNAVLLGSAELLGRRRRAGRRAVGRRHRQAAVRAARRSAARGAPRRSCSAEGGNPFLDYQLPQAAISLKQGAGRLIRTETDRGVLMICDPRLVDKPYGKRIWRSLPPMRRTRELDDVEAFFGESDAAESRRRSTAARGASARLARMSIAPTPRPCSPYQNFHHGLSAAPATYVAVRETSSRRMLRESSRSCAQAELVVAADQHVERVLVGRRARDS